MNNINYLQRIMLPLLIVFMGATAYAQQLQWQWAKQGAGTGGGNVAGMACDSAGNVYLSGSFADSVRFGETLLASQGESDIFLVKYDKDGNVLWAKSAGGAGNDYPSALYSAADGSLYVTGATGKDAQFDGKPAGEKKTNLFIARYTDEGELQWITAWPARKSDYITCVAADTLGHAYIGGYFEKNMTVDAQHQISSSGKTDAFAACFNPDGALQWLNAWGGKGDDRITALHAGNRQLLLCGVCRSPITIGSYLVASEDNNTPASFIVRSATNGEVLAVRKFAEGADMHVARIRPLSNGHTAIGGSFSGMLKCGADTARSRGNHDVFVASTDSAGAAVWLRHIGSYGFDKLYDVMEHAASGIVVSGIYSGILFVGGDTASFQSRRADLFNIGLDYEGEKQWISTTRGRTEQYPAALAQDAKGNIYVAGAFRDTLSIRRSTLAASKGNYNVFFAKLHYCESHQLRFACDTLFEEGATLALKLEGGYASYRWDRGLSTAPEYKVRCGGVYRVAVTDSLNCVYRDSITVRQTPATPVLQIRAEIDRYQLERTFFYNTQPFLLARKDEIVII